MDLESLTGMNKTQNYLIVTYILLLGALVSCNNKNSEPLSTELRVNIKQISGNDTLPKGGVTVELYGNQTDMQLRKQRKYVATTDFSGVAIFKGIRSSQYYVYAFFDNTESRFDNSKGQNNLFEDLIEGSITVANLTISKSRPINPTTVTIEYVEVLKYDTVRNYKNLGLQCSDSLRFFLKVQDAGYNSYLVDSSTSNYLGATFKYCNFCYKKGVPPDYPEWRSYFGVNTISINDFISLSISAKLKKSIPPYTISQVDFGDANVIINFSEYKNNNTNGYAVYPTRFRVVDNIVSGGVVNDKYIDIVVSWN